DAGVPVNLDHVPAAALGDLGKLANLVLDRYICTILFLCCGPATLSWRLSALRPYNYQLFLYGYFQPLQTRHSRGFWRVDFRGVFCMGWQMLAITTPRLARTRVHLRKSSHRKISLDLLVRAR